jgi:hypothetical protein
VKMNVHIKIVVLAADRKIQLVDEIMTPEVNTTQSTSLLHMKR